MLHREKERSTRREKERRGQRENISQEKTDPRESRGKRENISQEKTDQRGNTSQERTRRSRSLLRRKNQESSALASCSS